MYGTGQRGISLIVGPRARQTPARAQTGNHGDALRRHNRNCNEATTNERRRSILADLLAVITNDTVLRHVTELLDQDGEKAAGPNGLQLYGLTGSQRWQLVRVIRQLLRSGNYQKGPTRQVQIPKPHKPWETRTLEIPNLEDQIVQKAIEQALQPLLDPRFDQGSFGFRPRLGPEHALATVLTLAEAGRTTLITEDLSNAFTTVPHGRLLDALASSGYDIPQDVVRLIAECIRNEANRGIPQGGSLSPLLLNVYLDKHLDRLWRRQSAQTRLVRYADDICVCCHSRAEALEAYARLTQILVPTGMSLKGNREDCIRDLSLEGATAELLGYTLARVNGQLTVSLSEKSWRGLEANLQAAHGKPESAVKALLSMESFVDHAGPSLRTVDIQQLHARITQVAAAHGFDDVLTIEEIQKVRQQALDRFERVLRKAGNHATRPVQEDTSWICANVGEVPW